MTPWPQPVGFQPQQTSGPNLGPILELHRAPDGYVQFMKADPKSGDLRPLHSVQRGALESWFPEFAEELARDAYFSLNAFYRAGTRKSVHLRWLNVAYADLDGYRRGWTFGQTLGAVVDAQRDGLLPPASWFIESGRGLWLLYLLRAEHDPEQPVRAWPETIHVWGRIQAALHRTLAGLTLHPDPNATDASRVARVPGSMNTAAGARAHAYPQLFADPDRPGQLRGYTYTLPELAEAFGVQELPRPETVMRWESQRKIPANRAGYRALHAKRVGDLDVLWGLRGGFREGHRNVAALVYACHLRGLGAPDSAVLEQVHELARDCQPPLSDGEVGKAVRASQRRYPWTDAELAKRLEISADELQHLDSIDPNRAPRLKAGPKPRQVRAERHAAILRLVEQRFGGVAPSTRRMVDELASEGVRVSQRSVVNDYQALGLVSSPQLKIHYGATPKELAEHALQAADDGVEIGDANAAAARMGIEPRAYRVILIVSLLKREQEQGHPAPNVSQLLGLLHKAGLRISRATLRRDLVDIFGQATLPPDWSVKCVKALDS